MSGADPLTLDPRITPARPDLAARHLDGLVMADRYADGTAMIVAVARAPLRPRPDERCPLDSELLFGERFTVYESHGGWSWGQLATDAYVGYVPTAALGPVVDPTHRIVAPRSQLYSQADLKLPALSTLPFGARLAVTETIGKWLRLATGGFVFAGHAAPFDSAATDPVALAESLLGTPYLWGGRSGEGIDCSGLVQAVLLACAIACPRDSDQQAKIGRPLGAGETPRRGDLLCYQGHVALVRDAETVIHATAQVMAVTIEPRADIETRVRAEARIAPASPATRTIRRFDPGAGEPRPQ